MATAPSKGDDVLEREDGHIAAVEAAAGRAGAEAAQLSAGHEASITRTFGCTTTPLRQDDQLRVALRIRQPPRISRGGCSSGVTSICSLVVRLDPHPIRRSPLPRVLQRRSFALRRP